MLQLEVSEKEFVKALKCAMGTLSDDLFEEFDMDVPVLANIFSSSLRDALMGICKSVN